jgi:hypothetical protein
MLRAVAVSAAVALSASLHAQPPAPRWTLVPEMRIDGNANDLVPVQWFDVSSKGSIVVAQPQDKAIRIFSATGASLGKFGRAGQGPGEFENVNRAGWIGDTIWVMDAMQRRLTFVSPRLTFMRSVSMIQARPLPADAARVPVMSFINVNAVYPDGSVLASTQPSVEGLLATPGAVTSAYSHIAPDGVIRRIVARLPEDGGSVNIKTADGGVYGASTPFYASTLRDDASDGSRIAFVSTAMSGRDANTFGVTVIGAKGDTIFSRRYPFTPVPLPRAAYDSVLDLRLARAMIPEQRAALRSFSRPPAYPPLSLVLVGRDGTIWIRLRTVSQGRPWLVLDPKGEPIGSLMLSAEQAGIAVADRQNVWTLEADADGVQSIVRYRIQPAR